jgi:hypothetical protein
MPFDKRHSYKSHIDPAAALSPLRTRKFVRDYFGGQPLLAASVGYGNPAGTTGATNRMVTPQCNYEYHIKGAGQTILGPSWVPATGLLFGLDLVDNEGIEISAGIGALDLGSFVVGADRAFYAKTQILIADVSGTDEFLFGFRINQAYQAAHTSYTDYAAIGITTAAATADVIVKTRLNSGTAATVDTTVNWADTNLKTLEVQVKDDGYARFLIDGAEPPVTKTDFKFDAGDSVNWFLFWLYATTTPAAVHAKFFEFGYSPRRGE